MITSEQYFGLKAHNDLFAVNAMVLLGAVNKLLAQASDAGYYDYGLDPDTGSQISGSKGGTGDGGFRLSTSKTGAVSSKHKSAQAVDVYDPERRLAQWCISNKDLLAHHNLWMEDPRWTPVWVHFQCVPPASGKLVYIPSTSPALAVALEGQGGMPDRVVV